MNGADRNREECRDARGIRLLQDGAKDLRYAVRMLRRSPGFTAVAVLSLALGIGANTAIFTLIESTLLRPISVKHPERLRLLMWTAPDGGWVAPNVGYVSPTFGTIYEQRLTPDRALHARRILAARVPGISARQSLSSTLSSLLRSSAASRRSWMETPSR